MGYKMGQKLKLYSMDYTSENLLLKIMQHYFGSGRHLDQIQLGSTKSNILNPPPRCLSMEICY